SLARSACRRRVTTRSGSPRPAPHRKPGTWTTTPSCSRNATPCCSPDGLRKAGRAGEVYEWRAATLLSLASRCHTSPQFAAWPRPPGAPAPCARRGPGHGRSRQGAPRPRPAAPARSPRVPCTQCALSRPGKGGTVAIAFRASAEATAQSGQTVITIPNPVQAGDALILVGGMNDAGVSDFDWAVPSGWTRLRHSRVGSDVYGALYGRVATAGDAGSQVVLDTDSTGKSGVVLAAYSGTDPVAPFHAHAMRVETTSTTSHTTPTVTVTVEDARIVIAAIQGNSAVESWGTAS